MSWLIGLGALVGMVFFLGLMAFLAGIGLVGWLHSKAVGLVSTIAGALSFLAVVALLISLFSRGGS